MRRRLICYHAWLAKKLGNKYLRLYTDVIILSASSYLMLKKIFEFSISGWLLEKAFQQPLVDSYVVLSAALLFLAIILKLFMLSLDHFPPLNHNSVEPDEISNCLHRINSEISNHIEKCCEPAGFSVSQLPQQHACKVNLAFIVDALAEHIRKSITSIQIKKKDIFISLYTYDEASNKLLYMFHYDSKRDLVESKAIDLNLPKFQSYECVKCLTSANTTAYVLEKNLYAKGASKRSKTIEHYIGCKLATEEKIFGFLNIEFHNHAIFSDENSMQDFMEEHIFPFKLLFEYQFLKKDFFGALEKVLNSGGAK